MKKYLIFVLVLYMLFAMSGCGKAEKDLPAEQLSTASPTAETAFHFERSDLPGAMTISVSQYADGKDIYLCGLNGQNKPLLYKCDVNGNYTEIPLPDDIDYIQVCCKAGDKIAVIAGDYPVVGYDGHGNDVWNEDMISRETKLLILDESGKDVTAYNLEDELCMGQNFLSLRYLDEKFYLLSASDLFQLDEEGGILNNRHLNAGMFSSQTITDNGLSIAYIGSPEDGSDYGDVIDVLSSADSFEFNNILPPSDLSIYTAGNTTEGDFILMSGPDIKTMPAEGGELSLLYDKLKNHESWSYTNICPFSDGYILSRPGQMSIDMIAYGEEEESKPELMLWTSYKSDILLSMVQAYNESGAEFNIHIEELQDVNDDILRAKIAGGEGPDLYLSGKYTLFSDISEEAVYEDLLPYLDKTEAGRDNLIPAVLNASLSGDKLYSLPVSVEMYTLLCREPDLVSPEMSFLDILALPQVQDGSVSVFTKEVDRNYIWHCLSNMYLGAHLDEQNGVCDFNTEEFYNILVACSAASAPGNTSPDDVPCLFSPEHIVGMGKLLGIQMMCGENWYLDTGMGISYDIWDALAISNTSEHKEAAWDFIEFAMKTSPLSSMTMADKEFILPASKQFMDQFIAEAQNPGIWNYSVSEYEPLSDNCISQFKTALEQPAFVMDKYPGLLQIMSEEAAKYFAGDKSPEEVAEATQSRADIYLAERR